MLLLELAVYSLMDLVLWAGGRTWDRARSARRIAAFGRGEAVTVRCRYRKGAQAPAMARGKIVLSRSGTVLERPGRQALRLTGPVSAATGGGRGGTALTCTAADPAGGSGEEVVLLLLTWDAQMVRLVADSVSGPA
ncbi:hypothetical protein [Streptomyces sp. 2P-4]|uniref:hypothetical protein n=1 Tax=Streptomyces sp. 2P-4 TaxID=2931974 RepID=UPI0025406288|nr:hypothetical protein [Streptomyces sp. 2P-4]